MISYLMKSFTEIREIDELEKVAHVRVAKESSPTYVHTRKRKERKEESTNRPVGTR